MNTFKFGLTTLALTLALATPAPAEMRRTQVSQSQSQGEAGPFPELALSPHWGLTLSFIKTGEQIQQVRVGDPSRILTDFDTPLEGQRSHRSGGAHVIYLRQLAQPLDLDLRLPGPARHSNQVPLTVITQGRSGLNLYQFQLSLGQASQHSTVEVVPDGQLPRPQNVQIQIPRDIQPGELPLPPLEPPANAVRLKPVRRS